MPDTFKTRMDNVEALDKLAGWVQLECQPH